MATEEPRINIDVENWREFLEAFSIRNNDRRARFEVFRRGGTVEEEEQEAHLEDIKLVEENGSRKIEILRIDRGEKNAEKVRDEVTDVRGVTVQYDLDGSEGALEITDSEESLISLRFESKIDGAS